MTYLTNPSAPATPPARHTGAGVQHRHMMIDSNNIVVMTTRDITHCRPSLTPRCPSHPPARCVVVALLGQAFSRLPQLRILPKFATHPGFHQQHLIGRGVRPQRMASHDEVVCQIPHARLQQQQQQPSAVVIVVVWIYRSSSFRTPQDSQALRMKLVRKISLPFPEAVILKKRKHGMFSFLFFVFCFLQCRNLSIRLFRVDHAYFFSVRSVRKVVALFISATMSLGFTFYSLASGRRTSSAQALATSSPVDTLILKAPCGSKPADDPSLSWGTRWDHAWARNGKGKGTAVRQVLLIRHGQYHHYGSDDVNRLTPLGIAQSYRTGRHLAELVEQAGKEEAAANALQHAKAALSGCEKRFRQLGGRTEWAAAGGTTPELQKVKQELEQRRREYEKAKAAHESCGSFLLSSNLRTMYVSDMIRAKETAQAIREGMAAYNKEHSTGRSLPPLRCDKTLRERYPCPVEPDRSANPKKPALADKRTSGTTAEWLRKPLTWWQNRHPTGPKSPEIAQTTDATVDVLVVHSNMIRYLLLRALQLPPEAWLRLSTSHCSLTSLKMRENGSVSLQAYGSCGHLPPDQITVRNTH
eukprot:gene8106-5642_t